MAVTSPQTRKVTPMPAFVGSVHEGIPVHDAEVARDFYVRVFGLKVLPRPPIGPGYWLGDDNDTVQFHIIQSDKDVKPGPEADISPTGRHTAWVVHSLEPFRQRLRGLGIEFKELPAGSIVPSAQLFVKDPDGHTWEFQEPVS